VRKRIVCKVAFVVTTLAAVVPAYASEITDKTPCSELVSAMDSKNTERIREFLVYEFNVMDTMDIEHTQRGEPGIMSQLSDEGKINLASVTSVQCRNHPKMTVYNSTALVYRGTREMEIQFGTAK
jgi:hypothetical protein